MVLLTSLLINAFIVATVVVVVVVVADSTAIALENGYELSSSLSSSSNLVAVDSRMRKWRPINRRFEPWSNFNVVFAWTQFVISNVDSTVKRV